MNKIILMGRLTTNPQLQYTKTQNPTAICKYTLAVNKKYKRVGEPEANFISCVAFGKVGEFASKYFVKGQLISVTGTLNINNYEDRNGVKRVSPTVTVEEQFFTGDRINKDTSNTNQNELYNNSTSVASDEADDELPF